MSEPKTEGGVMSAVSRWIFRDNRIEPPPADRFEAWRAALEVSADRMVRLMDAQRALEQAARDCDETATEDALLRIDAARAALLPLPKWADEE